MVHMGGCGEHGSHKLWLKTDVSRHNPNGVKVGVKVGVTHVVEHSVQAIHN